MGLRAFFGLLPPRLPHSRAATVLGPVPLPPEVVLVLDGADPSDIAVQKGDAVKTGQDLARPGRGPLVATATGRVIRVDRCGGSDGNDGAAVFIATAADDTLAADLQPLADLDAAAPIALREALLRAGLPDLDALRAGARVKHLVVSALDEAPGCRINADLLGAAGEELGAALLLWRRACEVETVLLALPQEASSPGGLAPAVRIVRVPQVYPHGLPEMLAIRAGGWLFQQTPAGPRGDAVVIGLEVALAGLRCLRDGRPFCEKTISCLGPNDRQPRNVTVRIGTPAARVLEQLGLQPQAGGKLLLGSPLRGSAVPDPSRPIRANTHQLLLQAPDRVHRFQRQACTNCGNCTDICPVDLEVHLLGRFAEYDRHDRCADLAVERCVDCGLCAYVCPAHRPLAQLMMHAKQTLWRSPERRQAPVETGGCNACGPSCPAIRLFDLGADKAPRAEEKRS